MLEGIRNGRTDLVHAWVEAGKDARATDEQGVSILKWCAYYGDVSALRFLLAHGERLESLGENFDLNGAAFHGHWQLCAFLLEQGADPDHPFGEAGETPLHVALTKANSLGGERVVSVLLAGGADPNRQTKAGVEIGSFMRDVRSKGETPLHRAAAFGTERSISALIDAGAVKEAKDGQGDTPLAWASWHLRPAAIMRLLCYQGHSIHPSAQWTGDHGHGPSGMEINLLGMPVAKTGRLPDPV